MLLFIVGLFRANSALDIYLHDTNIQFHDTFYVFPWTYYTWAPAFALFFFWLLYLATKNILFSNALSRIHILITLVGCMFIWAVPHYITNSFWGVAGMPRRYYIIAQSERYPFFGKLSAATLVFLFALGQLIYLFNLLIGIFRRPNRKPGKSQSS